MSEWAYSFNGEHYSGTYSSKEEAIKDARREVEDDKTLPFPAEHRTLYIGIAIEPPITWSDMAENYIESMQENLDEYGEWAELFDGQVSREDETDLDRRLNETVQKWIKERNIKPGFFTVESVEEMDISEWYKEGGEDGQGK